MGNVENPAPETRDGRPPADVPCVSASPLVAAKAAAVAAAGMI